MDLNLFSLYLITPQQPPEIIVDKTERALLYAPPGRIAVQLRARHLPAAALFVLGKRLRKLTRQANAKLLINDRLDVAKLAQADGVQLPETGLSPRTARHILGDRALIGRSCHDRKGLEHAAHEGADFATLSPLFTSPGKGTPLGERQFARMAADRALPLVALGGVSAANAGLARAAGASGVAVLRAVYAAADPAIAVQQLLESFDAPLRA
ncbi:MAG: thiamine phosphate synthase [Proteobacteria bacterium]|nr:thiamine phosphate synthase [Pseudomonadota bacterium]